MSVSSRWEFGGAMRPEAPRQTFPFDARAEVNPGNSRTVSTRVRELSLQGCFLEFPTSLPAGTTADAPFDFLRE